MKTLSIILVAILATLVATQPQFHNYGNDQAYLSTGWFLFQNDDLVISHNNASYATYYFSTEVLEEASVSCASAAITGPDNHFYCLVDQDYPAVVQTRDPFNNFSLISEFTVSNRSAGYLDFGTGDRSFIYVWYDDFDGLPVFDAVNLANGSIFCSLDAEEEDGMWYIGPSGNRNGMWYNGVNYEEDQELLYYNCLTKEVISDKPSKTYHPKGAVGNGEFLLNEEYVDGNRQQRKYNLITVDQKTKSFKSGPAHTLWIAGGFTDYFVFDTEHVIVFSTESKTDYNTIINKFKINPTNLSLDLESQYHFKMGEGDYVYTRFEDSMILKVGQFSPQATAYFNLTTMQFEGVVSEYQQPLRLANGTLVVTTPFGYFLELADGDSWQFINETFSDFYETVDSNLRFGFASLSCKLYIFSPNDSSVSQLALKTNENANYDPCTQGSYAKLLDVLYEKDNQSANIALQVNKVYIATFLHNKLQENPITQVDFRDAVDISLVANYQSDEYDVYYTTTTKGVHIIDQAFFRISTGKLENIKLLSSSTQKQFARKLTSRYIAYSQTLASGDTQIFIYDSVQYSPTQQFTIKEVPFVQVGYPRLNTFIPFEFNFGSIQGFLIATLDGAGQQCYILYNANLEVNSEQKYLYGQNAFSSYKTNFSILDQRLGGLGLVRHYKIDSFGKNDEEAIRMELY